MEIIDAGPVRIGIAATRANGKDYVDVRNYKTDHTGMLKPTSNGLLIPVDRFNDIMDAINRQYEEALKLEPPPLYYFKERVEDKTAVRQVHSRRVSATAREAVRRTPEDYGANSQRGYIFRCRDYELLNLTYTFQPTRPFAVWDVEKRKWTRCK